ncbi:helix-turn-helix domain-containing protein [Paenibacillus alkaliterrae]|uniref:LexA family protein n=1 Tax=Paenibacillus alkaliterrae TaxID=320909 RepID=UPI001F17067D|nr:LexA family transcriptional regulator [Paenibacillus alkaliterrae]MCF2938949.1 helix-turn-helix domain-containing protein [Paenibacillus alkaliterrae]
MLGETLVLLRKKKKLTQQDIADRLHLTRSTYAQYEINRRVPEYATLEKLADFFEVSIDHLVGRNEVQQLPHNAIPYDPSNMIRLPVLGTIKAGEPILMSEHTEGYELVEPEVLRGRRGFVLVVNGDSMAGDYIFNGDKVIVAMDEDVTASDIAVVAIDCEAATLKRVKCQDGMCVLIPSNTTYETQIYPAKQIHIIGKVIQIRRDL